MIFGSGTNACRTRWVNWWRILARRCPSKILITNRNTSIAPWVKTRTNCARCLHSSRSQTTGPLTPFGCTMRAETVFCWLPRALIPKRDERLWKSHGASLSPLPTSPREWGVGSGEWGIRVRKASASSVAVRSPSRRFSGGHLDRSLSPLPSPGCGEGRGENWRKPLVSLV